MLSEDMKYVVFFISAIKPVPWKAVVIYIQVYMLELYVIELTVLSILKILKNSCSMFHSRRSIQYVKSWAGSELLVLVVPIWSSWILSWKFTWFSSIYYELLFACDSPQVSQGFPKKEDFSPISTSMQSAHSNDFWFKNTTQINKIKLNSLKG